MDQLPPPGPGVLRAGRAQRRLELAVRDLVLQHFALGITIWIIMFVALGITSLVCFVIMLVQFARTPQDAVQKCDGGSLSLYVWLNVANLIYQHT